jgi:hypothetical protein
VEETNEKCIPLIADLLFGFWRKGGECVIGNKGLFSLHYHTALEQIEFLGAKECFC